VKAWQREHHQRQQQQQQQQGAQRGGVDYCTHPCVTENDDAYYVCLACAKCFQCLPSVWGTALNKLQSNKAGKEDEEAEKEEEEEEEEEKVKDQSMDTDGPALQPLPDLPELLSQINLRSEAEEEKEEDAQMHPADRIEVELSDLRDSFYRWKP
jgi:hypothetical protein